MEQWWYAVGSERAGPVDVEALRALYRQGTIGPATLAWHGGMAEWAPIGGIPELSELQQLLPAAPSAQPAVQARVASPWQRLLARTIDMLIVGIALKWLSRIVGVHLPVDYLSGALMGLVITPLLLLIETAWFASNGWTPGKKLLGISVRTLDGGVPDFKQYGRRMVSLWWYGLAAGLPIIVWIAMVRQYLHLRAGKTLVWDRDRFAVTAAAPGPLQWGLALGAAVLLWVLWTF